MAPTSEQRSARLKNRTRRLYELRVPGPARLRSASDIRLCRDRIPRCPDTQRNPKLVTYPAFAYAVDMNCEVFPRDSEVRKWGSGNDAIGFPFGRTLPSPALVQVPHSVGVIGGLSGSIALLAAFFASIRCARARSVWRRACFFLGLTADLLSSKSAILRYWLGLNTIAHARILSR
jgi:hypothetical protein